MNAQEDKIESRRIINNKKYRVLYHQVTIDKSIDEVWQEVSGNFTNGADIAKSINSSRCLSGNLTEGIGTERYLNINFEGGTLEVKERIIDFKESHDFRELTYYVYESKGSPLKIDTYFTWTVQKGKDGKTYLSTTMIFRARFTILNALVNKKIKQSGTIRTGLLTYKHYLETGQKKVEDKKLNELYPFKN